MRKLLLITAVLFNALCLSAQSISTPIFTIGASGNIVTNSSFIEPVFASPAISSLGYILKNPISVQIGSKNYSVRTAVYTPPNGSYNRASESGFNIIDVSLNNQSVLTLQQDEIWRYSKMGYFFDWTQYGDNKYFLRVPLSETAQALILTGWVYDNTPPLLTIIVVTESDVKLVYNKEMRLNDITKTDNKFAMTLQSNVPECDKFGKYLTPVILHTIWRENGVLRFGNGVVAPPDSPITSTGGGGGGTGGEITPPNLK